MVVTEGVLVGDWFQTIVDVQVTSEDVGPLATEVVRLGGGYLIWQ